MVENDISPIALSPTASGGNVGFSTKLYMAESFDGVKKQVTIKSKKRLGCPEKAK